MVQLKPQELRLKGYKNVYNNKNRQTVLGYCKD